MKTTFLSFLFVLSFWVVSCSDSTESVLPEYLIISNPENEQVLYTNSAEIIISLPEDSDFSTFQAWLNDQEITNRFKPVDGGLRALVGPDDGLVIGAENVTTHRDDKGVWSIQGGEGGTHAGLEVENTLVTRIEKGSLSEGDEIVFSVDRRFYDAFEAMGYAVATDRLWQAELSRRAARGRLAEILGPDQLLTDIFMRTIGYSEKELENGFASLDERAQAIITGYIQGFNRRIEEIRISKDLLPFEFASVEAFPEEWSESDILAISAFMQRNFDPEAMDQDQVLNGMLLQDLMARFGQSALDMFNDLRWVNDPDAQTVVESPSQSVRQVSALSKPDPGSAIESKGFSSLENIDTAILADLKKAGIEMKARKKQVFENLKKINARIKMGSYAWVVSGEKTVSGNSILYSGPQMGFSVPSIVAEGSLCAAGLNVSGMVIPGVPGILVGRTPHHAWSLQVGHAHTTDYYIESEADVYFDRSEVIHVSGQEDVILPVHRTDHGPVVNPMPYDPESYEASASNPILSWRYVHAGHEFKIVEALTGFAEASTMEQFGESIAYLAVSQHLCYADRDGNIAYWMSGRDPVRPSSGEYRLPQGALGKPEEWDDSLLKPRSHDSNPQRGYYGGWNNKSRKDYDNAYNSNADIYGPFQRAHVIESYLSQQESFTFEDLRDLALNIATTESFTGPRNGGGNPWAFVENAFTNAIIEAGSTPERDLALEALSTWDGHMVAGGSANWATGETRAGAWVLMDAWIKEVIRLTFEDELPKDLDDDGNWVGTYLGSDQVLLFNVILHALNDGSSGVRNQYDWFSNLADSDAPQQLDDIIVLALDTVMEEFGGEIPEDIPREDIVYTHDLLGEVGRTPYSFRSTYAQVVEMGSDGPVRIESMFPLGQSGEILVGDDQQPVFHPHFFSMTSVFDAFKPRDFPVAQDVCE
jgi:penicillin amidase